MTRRAVETARASLNRAAAIARAHPAVLSIAATPESETNLKGLDITFRVNLPSEWKAAGKSPNDIRPQEVVRFHFLDDYPLRAPVASLREDFPTNLPHFYSGRITGRPLPCLFDGEVNELFHRDGFASLLDQTAVWLDRAATNSLTDPVQGWEPVRRDSCSSYLDGNARILRQLEARPTGYRFFPLTYFRLKGNRPSEIYGSIGTVRVQVGTSSVQELFVQTSHGTGKQVRYSGRSVALVVWPAKASRRARVSCDKYLPETVHDLNTLEDRAALYGCKKELTDGLSWISTCVSQHDSIGSFPLAVVLLVRRPFNLIDQKSAVELCPYVLEAAESSNGVLSTDAPVRAAAHLEKISGSLLAEVSGEEPKASARNKWTLIGAGSVGSKVALHLARSGRGPEVVVDKAFMRPHNLARHALTRYMDNKASLLCAALTDLGQNARPLVQDAIAAVLSTNKEQRMVSPGAWAVVNTSASLTVHEALAAATTLRTRVIETVLFAGGRVALIAVEGPRRNPNTADLMARFYAMLRHDTRLAAMVLNRSATLVRQNIGQGCGSLTMRMSDGRLSVMSSGISEYLLAKQRKGLPSDEGELLIGTLADDGMGATWERHAVPRVSVVKPEKTSYWQVRILEGVAEKMQKEVARRHGVETGGVLIGRISEPSCTAHIVDVIEAPDDSVFAHDKFVLGTRGLRRAIGDYVEAVDGALYCLGTWHSHLDATGPSTRDETTAHEIATSRLTPSVFLIHTPDGYRALVAEGDVGPVQANQR